MLRNRTGLPWSCKVIGPLGLALICGQSNFVSPKASLDFIVPAMLFLAFWSFLSGIAFLFGIETKGQVMHKLIERNTTIPKRATETFSTAEDNQTTVTVQVYQGERPLTRDNRLLDKFNLENIQPAPRGASPSHMVRSFSIQSGVPSHPTRRCAMSGVRRERRPSASAQMASMGSASRSRMTAAARSQTAMACQFQSVSVAD